MKCLQQRRSIFYNFKNRKANKPTGSEVLTSYLKQCKEPPWTSYFVKVTVGSFWCTFLREKYKNN
ncbi:unnamed protein product [Acanthoscelides obtectus]|uniref:Uncharacterized protein n=1 Tax=Acanthoscelides obtectus TaxID=200917 RepID=A0A9P0M0K3_ACAOB|nr:unnamed protein product [Acanthoscelides obtectus]CAK1644070.1 hypothetical protein AOBTE_LOCUS13808 [Acanthoscelides obtectus]